jgi:methylthioribose-1-phosphate isomerase
VSTPPPPDAIRAIVWDEDGLKLLDQRHLPAEIRWLTLTRCDEVAEAIADMVVRGAPAIGIAAAYGVVLSARTRIRQSPEDWHAGFSDDLDSLARARPTAVNLRWAIEFLRTHVTGLSTEEVVPRLLAEAQAIHRDDIAANHRLGQLGAALLDRPGPVLTHCNTGSLATGGFGTALGVIRTAYAQGRVDRVFADETRPWLQGSRLTAWELARDGIPVTLVCDGAAAWLMRSGKIGWVIVGADRIAANGDTANKIGTYGLAVAARHHQVRLMVAAPTSTIDASLPDGSGIPVEEREAHEILTLSGERIAADGASAWNPAFDITPADLIDAIVTERGVAQPPTRESIRAMLQAKPA